MEKGKHHRARKRARSYMMYIPDSRHNKEQYRAMPAPKRPIGHVRGVLGGSLDLTGLVLGCVEASAVRSRGLNLNESENSNSLSSQTPHRELEETFLTYGTVAKEPKASQVRTFSRRIHVLYRSMSCECVRLGVQRWANVASGCVLRFTQKHSVHSVINIRKGAKNWSFASCIASMRSGVHLLQAEWQKVGQEPDDRIAGYDYRIEGQSIRISGYIYM
jgi:hypothetical protein